MKKQEHEKSMKNDKSRFYKSGVNYARDRPPLDVLDSESSDESCSPEYCSVPLNDNNTPSFPRVQPNFKLSSKLIQIPNLNFSQDQ